MMRYDIFLLYKSLFPLVTAIRVTKGNTAGVISTILLVLGIPFIEEGVKLCDIAIRSNYSK